MKDKMKQILKIIIKAFAWIYLAIGLIDIGFCVAHHNVCPIDIIIIFLSCLFLYREKKGKLMKIEWIIMGIFAAMLILSTLLFILNFPR
jgi:hypothetical protein